MHYQELVELYKRISSTTKRLEKTDAIAEFLKEVKAEDMETIILLVQGKLYPSWDERKIGVASRLIVKAISISTGIPPEKVEAEWKMTGDLGEVAKNLIGKKKQSTLFQSSLTVKKVFTNLRKLAELEGEGTVSNKMQLISELLTSAKPEEAKYIVRTLLEELRVGIGEGSLRDAICWAFFGKEIGIQYDKEENDIGIKDRELYNKYMDAVQRAYDLTNDFASVAKAAKESGLKGLEKLRLSLGNPVKVMLAQKAAGIEDGFKRVEKPAALEYKLDGFRMQIHKNKEKIIIFTRRLEEVTQQFPDVVAFIKTHTKGDSFILDAEAVGFDTKTKKYLPFQSISQRIRRKYEIEKMAKSFPVELNVFDVIYYNGKNLLNEPFEERRKLLEKIIKPEERKIVPVKQIITESNKEAEKFYKESLAAGNEGIMFKNLKSEYKPGSRTGFMLKLKPTMDTLDLVIIKAEWGEGKRSAWLSSFTVACIDQDGNFLEVGKVSTGLKEKDEEGLSFNQITELLKPLIIAEKGREVTVKPKVVIEVSYEEIQKSPTYASGYALRFPRVLSLRVERSPEDISTLDLVEDYYYGQKK